MVEAGKKLLLHFTHSHFDSRFVQRDTDFLGKIAASPLIAASNTVQTDLCTSNRVSAGEEAPFASMELSFGVAHEQDSKNDQ